MKVIMIALCALLVTACASHTNCRQYSLYSELGGQAKNEEIIDNFIHEIEFNKDIFAFFKDSDIGRFRAKMLEYVCFVTGGRCKYTGDTMLQVHQGMNITEAQFNLTVDLFINAMDKANIPHPTQNKVLARLAPTRKDMIYK